MIRNTSSGSYITQLAPGPWGLHLKWNWIYQLIQIHALLKTISSQAVAWVDLLGLSAFIYNYCTDPQNLGALFDAFADACLYTVG